MRLIDADAMQVEWLARELDNKTYNTNDMLDSIDEQPSIDPEYKRPTTYIVGEQVPTEHIKDYNHTRSSASRIRTSSFLRTSSARLRAF